MTQPIKAKPCPVCGYINDGVDPQEWNDGMYDCENCLDPEIHSGMGSTPRYP